MRNAHSVRDTKKGRSPYRDSARKDPGPYARSILRLYAGGAVQDLECEQPLRRVREALPSGIMPVGIGRLAARVGRGERR
jgi:hypothetical protein